MDSNKREALRKVNWKPAKTCGTCHFGGFEKDQEWGICLAESNEYTHKKHDRVHHLPAHKMSVCDKFVVGVMGTFDYIIDFLNAPVTS